MRVQPQVAIPQVSIIIVYYKRRDALEGVLRSVMMQDYPLREIIVVDNNSQDDVQGFLAAWDPSICCLHLSDNLGPGAARNAGIEAAHGEILVTIDNDVSFACPSDISNVVRVFDEHPEFHVLAFQICDAADGKLRTREWCHPNPWQEFGDRQFETNFFGEGASAYRREVFRASGLYYPPLFIGHEGLDLALRVLDSGFRVLYTPEVRVIHSMSPETRTPERPFYFYTRNYIWIAYKDYSFFQAIRFLTPKLMMMTYFTVRSGHYRAFFKGLWDGFKGLWRVHPHRTPIKNETIRYYARLDSTRPNVWQRLKRHRSAPQL